jgi:hypothetical protein
MKRRPEDKYAPRTPLAPSERTIRAAISNGTTLGLGIDERSAWARRLRDLIRGHEQDLGGRDLLSEAQLCLVRRVAMMQLQLETMEAKWAEAGGAAPAEQLHRYQSCSNSLRRIAESLGLNRGRRAREVMTPAEYARAKWQNSAKSCVMIAVKFLPFQTGFRPGVVPQACGLRNHCASPSRRALATPRSPCAP